MRIILILLSLLLAGASAWAQGQTLPPNTVLGRTGISPGPAQAIPFDTLSQLLSQISANNDAYVCVQADGVNCAGVGADAGLCNTPATACRTVLYTTEQVMQNYNGGGTPVTVHIGSGFFNNDIAYIMGCPPGTSNGVSSIPCLVLQGNGSANTLIDGGTQGAGGTIIANQFANIGVEAMTVRATGAGTVNSIYANLNGFISVFGGDVSCGPSPAGSCVAAEQQSNVEVFGNMTVTAGSYAAFFSSTGHSLIQTGGNTITFVGTPTITNVINVSDASLAALLGVTWSGAVHAGTSKYNVQANSVITTAPGTCAGIPGTGFTTPLGGLCY